VKADSIPKLNRTGKNQLTVTAPFGAQPEKVDQYGGASGFSAGPFFCLEDRPPIKILGVDNS
jgi:hypothetical protein